MESHANHIHKAPGHGWKHYFYEFLMLFLAVFCGFLSENMRETRINREREVLLMESMIKNLEQDTAQVNLSLKDTARFAGMDSLIGILQLRTIKKMDQDKAFRLLNYYAVNYEATSSFATKSTLTQLNSGGNMWLVRKQIVVDSLNRLDITLAGLNDQFKAFTNSMDKSYNIEDQIFDFYYYKHRKEKAVFMTDDISLIHQCANSILMQKLIYLNYFYMLTAYSEQCTRLIKLIKKEYHI